MKGETLKEVIRVGGFKSQSEFSRASGICENVLSGLITNQRRITKTYTLRIQRALNAKSKRSFNKKGGG